MERYGEGKIRKALVEAFQDPIAKIKLSKLKLSIPPLEELDWYAGKDYSSYCIRLGLPDAPTTMTHYKLLLLLLGRLYYTTILTDGGGELTYITPIIHPISVGNIMYARGLVSGFEITYYPLGKPIRFSRIPDIAKPVVLASLLDPFILTALSLSNTKLAFSIIDLHEGKIRGSSMLVIHDQLLKLAQCQEILRRLVLLCLETGDVEIMRRLAYALLERDADGLASINLSLLNIHGIALEATELRKLYEAVCAQD
jgi:hypothetical protein